MNSNAIEWLRTGERGASAETMLAHFEGLPQKIFRQRGAGAAPHDNSDFRRCRDLLEVVPDYRSRINELHDLPAPWPTLVTHWTKLERLLEKQEGGDSEAGGQLYERLREIRPAR